MKNLMPFFACVCCVLLWGCSRSDEPAIGTVRGIVTLNGDPLPEAYLVFSPMGNGFPSIGKTDANGQYELTYKGVKSGAVVGEHRVGISTVAPESNSGAELVPDVYRKPDSLMKTVTSGQNVLDFPLEGESPKSKAKASSTQKSDTV